MDGARLESDKAEKKTKKKNRRSLDSSKWTKG
jgi:hypothetical protein